MPRPFRTVGRTALLLLATFAVPEETATADDRAPLLSARSLAEKLDETVPVVRWSGVPYRTAVRRLTEPEGIAVVVDRRVDPSREITFEATGRTFGGVLDGLAEDGDATRRTLGGTVFLGPPRTTRLLRTLVRTGVDAIDADLAAKRRVVRWDDFATPREVLDAIATTYGVKLVGTEDIPHDLWAAGAISDATVVEALAIVLIQFDRTVEPAGDDLRIVPLPESVGVSKSYTLPRDGTAMLAEWRRRFPEAEFRSAGRRVTVVALVEEHEAIDRLRRGEEPELDRDPLAREPSPLDRQRFTLKLEGVPVRDLMKSLERQSGVIFSYDSDVLRRAGVDLTQRIDVDANDATPERFFGQMFDPLKLDFEIDGTTVRLTPRPGGDER